MKIFGRILIILIVFTPVMGITYVIVNARSSSAPPAFPQGERPGFPGGGREFRGERGGGEWLFGTRRNTAIIGIIVALIV